MRIIVVGTGTDIGKTHVVASMLAHARAARVAALGYKPITTGVEAGCDDSAQHAAAQGGDYVAPTFAYGRAVSPHIAAREENRAVDLDLIAERADALEQRVEIVIVETAGGLFTPLGDAHTNLDLVRRLSPAAVLLVAPDRLGVLHDVRACVLAAKGRGLSMSAFALSAPSSPDSSTGSNAAELAALGWATVSAVFPRAPFDAPESLEQAEALLAAVRGARSR